MTLSWKWLTAGAVVLAVNAAVWVSALHRGTQPLEGLWASMDTVKIPDRADVPPAYPADLRAKEGQRVTLSGVVFLVKGGIQDGRVRWCMLMPPSRYGCCGISCDPRPEMSVYVDCSAVPWPSEGRQQLVADVEGTLRLERDASSWSLYTLEDAVVRPAEATDGVVTR